MTDKEYLESVGEIVDCESGEVLAEICNGKVRLSLGWTLADIVECMNKVYSKYNLVLLPDHN